MTSNAKKPGRIIGRAGIIRLVVALIAGLGLGALVGRASALQNLIPYLLFPFLLGIAGALTIGTGHPHPYLGALGTGLGAWVGISIYLGLLASHAAPGSCIAGNCGMVPLLTALLSLYLLTGPVLVAAGSLLTSTIIKQYRLGRRART